MDSSRSKSAKPAKLTDAERHKRFVDPIIRRGRAHQR